MGGRKRSTSMVILMVITIIVSVMWDDMIFRSVQALSLLECKQERRILVIACQTVINGKPPSDFCCERLRAAHGECVCPDVTPQFAVLIDVKAAVKIIQTCGLRVPRHFKCGSIITP